MSPGMPGSRECAIMAGYWYVMKGDQPMVATVPEGAYTMPARKSIIAANAPKYRAGSKKLRSGLLDDLVQLTHLNRKYLGLVLRGTGRKVAAASGEVFVGDPACSLVSRRGRKKRYDRDILPALLFLWQLSRYVSSTHLVHFIRLNHARLFCHPKLRKLPAEVRAKLCRISPRTVDRLLRPFRSELLARRRYRPNPFASCLKKQIPVEAYHDKPTDQFGYLEVDLVSHGGQSPCGEFAYTLVVTEITTGWTELRVLRNKAHIWVMLAMRSIFRTLPFTPTAIHSDNGGEFINYALAEFADSRKLPNILIRFRGPISGSLTRIRRCWARGLSMDLTWYMHGKKGCCASLWKRPPDTWVSFPRP